MASKLNERDKALLDGNLFDIVGNKPYENGKWGTNEKDCVYLEIFDTNGNLIEYNTLSVSQFIINSSNDNIEFYPGTHIRGLGFESGTFRVRYNFIRKLAGDESAVLLHTLDKNDTKIGDVYTNTDKLYITEDGIVYNVTEQEFKDSPATAEQLAVEDLKYQIDEISPSRTEIRLKAKRINSSYIDDFINIQTKNKYESVVSNINFVGSNEYESLDLILTPENNSFRFTQQMINGTLTLPDVYKVDAIESAVRSEVNVVENAALENLRLDENGNIKFYGDREAWDPELHEDAVKADGWELGFRSNTQFGSGGIWEGTEHLGYHAKIVQKEGISGGNCIKFTDNNSIFEASPEWPTGYPYRLQLIGQYGLQKLSSLGVKAGDFINIKMDIKSTVPGKGVSTAIAYAGELLTEEQPTNPPAGYFDPTNPGPTETKPTNPPEGYQANTAAAASEVEPKPGETLSQILTDNPDLVAIGFGKVRRPNLPIIPAEIGDTTANTNLDGEGAWKIFNIFDDGDIVYTWSPNLTENLLVGILSTEEEWTWNGYVWNPSPNIANSPTPPGGVANNPNAVNHHPYVIKNSPEEYVGDSFYSRQTYRGQNRGWQTGTFLHSEEERIVRGGASSAYKTTTMLVKDDLIWFTDFTRGSTDNKAIVVKDFDTFFPNIRKEIIDTDTNKSLYDDIFEKGFIQSITRDDRKDFIIFYNNGDTNDDGSATSNSNRWFVLDKDGDNYVIREIDDKKVLFLSDINNGLNDLVALEPKRFEVCYGNPPNDPGDFPDGSIFSFFTSDQVFISTKDKSDDLTPLAFDRTDSYGDGGRYFKGLGPNLFPHVMIGQGGEHSGGRTESFLAITQDSGEFNRVYKTTGTGGSSFNSIEEYFYDCGVVGTGGDPLSYGVRNPGAENYGRLNEDGTITTFSLNNDNPFLDILYDNGTAIFDFDINPLQIGVQSEENLWKWNGYEWVDNGLMPPRYDYQETGRITVAPSEAGVWETIEISVIVPADWTVDQSWNFWLYGNGRQLEGDERQQGIVWVDNVFIDFTYTDQSETRDVLRPYQAQIKSVSADGLAIQVDKNYTEVAINQGQQDINETIDGFQPPDLPDSFDSFFVTYFNLNPKDLRTYLKFDNQMLLTTNFKQDVISVTEYPNSVVYKMYEPLPAEYQKLDECIVVKEMTNPLEETINIVDFIPEEEPRLVLKTPDLKNVESPIQARSSNYKSQSDILTSDSSVSEELRNEFLSQSLDSVEINTDYSRYENFVNFSSIEKRLRNFKTKLENIDSYKVSSASYVGVSGSASDLKFYHSKIKETKNTLDSFERYMYFESSSYQSGSLGISHDNAWPKTSGDGSPLSPYVLAETNSTKAKSWFSNAITSASLYDNENNNKLSSILPEFIKFDSSNQEYLTFTDMIGQHFDGIWEYINALSDTYDRRDKLDEGLSKELLYNVAKSLGWQLSDGKDLIDLPRFALGKQVSGSAYSDYSTIAERDISREIWGRIVNNMPFFLKNKGTVRALKGLINIYGIPSTILRVKEYGGPTVPDNETPQFEITRKFTKALDFRGGQSVKTAWTNDSLSGRKPDTIEFRFRAATGSNQILVEKQDSNNQDFFIRLKDNGSSDNYGFVSFMLSGSKVGVDVGEYKEITSSALPVFDGDFYSVMVARTSGSSNVNVSQSYELNVGKYDSSRSKIHLYSTSTMDVTQAASSSFSNAWTGSGDVYIGGSGSLATVGAQFSGSIMEYRQWTETLNTSSFKNHIANPKAYDGNSVSSSYENLVLRYSFDDNKSLASDTEGIRDVSSNQTTTLSGSHAGFTGNFFRSVVDEQKTHIPSIGALRRSTNKVRIEDNPIRSGQFLNPNRRVTNSSYDTAPNDSNKVGIWFAPTDVINNDIINSVGDLNFENFLGDPRDRTELSYRGLNFVADNYWKKYTAPNSFWDYIRLIKYYDQSMFPQLRKMIPARAKPDIGLLIEPNIFERPKVVVGKKPTAENKFYSASIDVTKEVINITGSYNHGSSVTSYEAYDGRIKIYSYETGSSVVSSSGANLLKEASGSEIRDSFIDRSIWQRLGEGEYSNVTMSFGDTLNGVKGGQQDIISGSRIYGVNQKTNNFFTSSADAVIENQNSSSFENTDLDNFSHLFQGLRNSFYEGVKNNNKTTIDGKPVIEVIISAPTKLVTTEEGESTLKTGDGIVPDFKEDDKDIERLMETFEEKRRKIKKKKRKRGLMKMKIKPETDSDRRMKINLDKIKSKIAKGELIVENDADGQPIKEQKFKQQTPIDESNDGIDNGVLNNEK